MKEEGRVYSEMEVVFDTFIDECEIEIVEKVCNELGITVKDQRNPNDLEIEKDDDDTWTCMATYETLIEGKRVHICKKYSKEFVGFLLDYYNHYQCYTSEKNWD